MKTELHIDNLFDNYAKNVFSNIISDNTGKGFDKNLAEQRVAQVERANNQINLRNAFVDTVDNIATNTVLASLNSQLCQLLQAPDIDLISMQKRSADIFAKAEQNPLLQKPSTKASLKNAERVFAKTVFPTLAKLTQEKYKELFLQNLETNLDADLQQIGFWYGACNGLSEQDPVFQQNKGFIIDKVDGLRKGLNELKLPADVKRGYSQKINKMLFAQYCDKAFKDCASLSDKIAFARSIKNNNSVVSLFNDGFCQVHCGDVSLPEKIALQNKYLLVTRNMIKAEKNQLVSNFIQKKLATGEGIDTTNKKVCAIFDDYFKNICSRVTANKDADYKGLFDLFLTQTGYVPRSMQDVVVALSSGEYVDADGKKNEQPCALGYSVLDNIIQDDNLKIEQNSSFQQKFGSLVFLKNLYKSFTPPEQARKAYNESLTPNAVRDENNGKDFDNIANTAEFKNTLANQLVQRYGDELLDTDVPDAFNAEVQLRARSYYKRTGDLNSSIEAAVAYQKKFGNYTISKIGTATPRLMQYAPESFYRTPYNSVDDMDADFKTFANLAYPKGETFLAVDAITRNEIKNGSQTPTYALMTKDEFGQDCSLLDDQNIPIRVGSQVFGEKEDDEDFSFMSQKLNLLNKLEKNEAFNALP